MQRRYIRFGAVGSFLLGQVTFSQDAAQNSYVPDFLLFLLYVAALTNVMSYG